ncbi:MAG: outer membrane protein assembly factor BamB family protein, partial [Planctomycetota bacterium]
MMSARAVRVPAVWLPLAALLAGLCVGIGCTEKTERGGPASREGPGDVVPASSDRQKTPASQAVQSGSPAKLAQEILEAAGVKGGLVVHVVCGDGKLTAALHANDSYLVHGLARTETDVTKARAHVAALGVHGEVSIDKLDGARLPYVAGLVNLVVSEDLGEVPMSETMRVLCPGGVAYVKQGGKWTKTVKPRPPGIDRWTHYLYDATNNAVSRDTVVGPPRQLQWVGRPNWARHHDRMASMNALVATRGRLFYVFDEGPTSSIMLPPRWTLIARDAFSGVVLWKRGLPTWHPHLWPMKSGFAQMPRRLVAVEDRAYVPLGYEEPLSCLDAATGRTLWTCADTKSVEEVICSDGVLYVLVNPRSSQYAKFKPKFENKMWDAMRNAASSMPWDERPRLVTAIQADTGRVLWRKEHRVAPLTLACAPRNVLFFDGERIVCLDRKSGDETWRSDKLNTGFPLAHFTKSVQKNTQKWRPPSTKTSFLPASFAPTLVAYKDVVLFSGGDGHMSGIAGETGKVLWTAEALPSGHFSPQDCLVIGGRVWTAAIAGGRDSGELVGRDPKTGEVVDRFPPDIESWYMHHRCHRAKATDRWFVASRTGTEFVDYEKHRWTDHHWVRGGCLYGIMPCNGLLYAPPHSCACYMQSKLFGFNALTSRTSKAQPVASAERLERGEAYDGPVAPQ